MVVPPKPPPYVSAVGVTGYRGVHLDKDRRSRGKPYYKAEVYPPGGRGKKIRCGAHRTPEEAARAYDAEARRCGIDESLLNFPNQPDISRGAMLASAQQDCCALAGLCEAAGSVETPPPAPAETVKDARTAKDEATRLRRAERRARCLEAAAVARKEAAEATARLEDLEARAEALRAALRKGREAGGDGGAVGMHAFWMSVD